MKLLEKPSYHEVETVLEAWALSEPAVCEYVMKVRRTRFEFLLEIFNEMRIDSKTAKREAMKFYCLTLGILHLPVQPSKADVMEVFSEYLSSNE